MRKMSQKCIFSKLVLDRKSISVYFQDTSVICLGLAGALTEREKADMRHEDKSQYGSMTWPQGLVDCLFARL